MRNLAKPKLILATLLAVFGLVVSANLHAKPVYAQVLGDQCSDGTFAPKGVAANCGVCDNNDFFGLVSWDKYLEKKGDCTPKIDLVGNTSQPDPNRFNVIWLIGLAIFEDILRVASVVAVAFIIYGGFRYITSQGQPDNTKAALSSIINAVIGLAIAIIGASIVSFIGAKLG